MSSEFRVQSSEFGSKCNLTAAGYRALDGVDDAGEHVEAALQLACGRAHRQVQAAGQDIEVEHPSSSLAVGEVPAALGGAAVSAPARRRAGLGANPFTVPHRLPITPVTSHACLWSAQSAVQMSLHGVALAAHANRTKMETAVAKVFIVRIAGLLARSRFLTWLLADPQEIIEPVWVNVDWKASGKTLSQAKQDTPPPLTTEAPQLEGEKWTHQNEAMHPDNSQTHPINRSVYEEEVKIKAQGTKG
ncbi:hypothetical protein EGW08_020408 [Elysia chlorotica]|uniref:Uncharacterized protein n=1 Tax=Elysia chlorotica TaxID=188477 RepID=A0A433SRT3_ELYCH|nr:hypothetical protein EGW08_020408 [Elysia chlorotica]